jgi:hypothetical protein
MKEITLTQNKVAQVDDRDYDFLSQWKWQAKKSRDTFYAHCRKNVSGTGHALKMHRIIMNTPPELEVDHVDHNGLNCQRNNLRNCTSAQNRMNRKKSWGRSKYKGVSFAYNDRIYARIKVNKKLIYLGTFLSEIDAAIAYNDAAKVYFGEFACLNNFDNIL